MNTTGDGFSKFNFFKVSSKTISFFKKTLKPYLKTVLLRLPKPIQKIVVPLWIPFILRKKDYRQFWYLGRYATWIARSRSCYCPNCGYRGKFIHYCLPPFEGAICPQCESFERHRLFHLAIERHNILKSGHSVLHFAPRCNAERNFVKKFKQLVQDYKTADIDPNGMDLMLNIEDMDADDNSFDVIICSHVLEHVDDTKALAELNRVLKHNGVLIAMVPIIEGWDSTYENADIQDPDDRLFHFGQSDHVRFYGADFRECVKNANFSIKEYTAFGEDCVTYGLIRGEKVFICTKT